MKTIGSPAAVLAAIREDANVEAERIEKEAEQEASRLAQEGTAAVEVPDREERLAAAARGIRERLAREDYGDSRAALEAREQWMREAAGEGRKLLLAPQPREVRRALLVQLAREALQRLRGEKCTLHVAPGDQDLIDDALLEELGVARGAPADISGGCIVRSASGKVSLDNSLEERARRFDTALRAALGKVYGS